MSLVAAFSLEQSNEQQLIQAAAPFDVERDTTMLSTLLSADDTARLQKTYIDLHREPELSMQEHNTAAFIETQLDSLNVEHFRCGGTGVVGIMKNGEGPVVAFRADTDGLPIAEDTGAEYSSRARGVLADGTEVPVMHGCGHDTHMAAALAAIRLFATQREAWSGTIVWIFQPGEETAQGAAAMVEDGLWDRAPRPVVVLGQHVGSLTPAGTVAITAGPAMALADSLRITVFGKQAHGSQPDQSIDPIVLGAHIVTRLQTIVSRELPAQTPAVVTCGSFHAGLKENIIPDHAVLTLNIRTLTPEVREQVLAAVERIVLAEAQASGAPEPKVEDLTRFPRLYNEPEATAAVEAALREALGDTNVLGMTTQMGSEDCGYLSDSIGVPGVFWFFGGYPEGAEHPPSNHSPFFLPVVEPTLTTAARAAASAIAGFLEQPGS